jgi:uncharacterized membrane protein YkoI
MKTRGKNFALAILTGALISTQADKVQHQQLTPDLQTKIRGQVGSNPIDDIDRNVKNGQTRYEVGYKDNGQQKELVFDQAGNLLVNNGASAVTSGKVAWDDLPAAVKQTARTRVTPAAVDDIDRQVKDGQTTYEIGFKQGTEQKELLLSQEGKILRDTGVPQGLVAGLTPDSQKIPKYSRPVALTETQKIEMNWAPATVQKEIKDVANGSAITQMEKGKFRNHTVYQATIQMRGQTTKLQIAENGQVIYDPRSLAAAGTAAASSSGSASSQYSNVISQVPLSAAVKVDRRSVPAPVERAIRTYVGSTPVQDIDRGTWNGHNIYQIAFKDNGRNIELQVDENGNLVFDPRNASK